VIKSPQNFDLVEEEIRLLDILLGDLLDSPPLPSHLFLGLVDYPIGPLAEFLLEIESTLGLKS